MSTFSGFSPSLHCETSSVIYTCHFYLTHIDSLIVEIWRPSFTTYLVLAKDSCVATSNDQFLVFYNLYTALNTTACFLLHELCPVTSAQVLYHTGSPTSEYLICVHQYSPFTAAKGHALGYPNPWSLVSQSFISWYLLILAHGSSHLHGISTWTSHHRNAGYLGMNSLYSQISFLS